MRLKITKSASPSAGRFGLDRVNPPAQPSRSRQHEGGFTFVEMMISFFIVALVFGGILKAYYQTGTRIQWTGYSLAAGSQAAEVIEQLKAATWDPSQAGNPPNQLTNMNLFAASYNTTTKTYTGYSVGALDIPYTTTATNAATNYITVQMINIGGNSNVVCQSIRVDTVWSFGKKLCTNTVCTIVAPDNAANGTF